MSSAARSRRNEMKEIKEAFLPGLPVDLILSAYRAAPGNEIGSGKFLSPESSAALAADVFGFFIERAGDFPPLPRLPSLGWPATSVRPEVVVRFPWSGGRHPCLDALVETRSAIIGVESKRYEPFRPKGSAPLPQAYWRNLWGDSMTGFLHVRDGLRDGTIKFSRLDARQLLKHAFALRTQTNRQSYLGKRAVLFYLFAEPERWHDGTPVSASDIAAHRNDIRRFAKYVGKDEVSFEHCSYRELLAEWAASNCHDVQTHAAAIAARFSV